MKTDEMRVDSGQGSGVSDSASASHQVAEAEPARQPNTSQKKTLVLGLGNVLMGDEGVGVYVVKELEKRTLPSGVEILDGGSGGFTLLEPLESADRIVIVDAANDGNPPGTVTRTEPRFSRDYPPTLTAHDIGVKDLLDVFYMRGGERRVVLYAITIDPHQPISMDLTETTLKAATQAIERVYAELTGR